MNAVPARKQDEEERNAPEVEAAFEAVPAEQIAEIIDGELHVQPRPRIRHARAASMLDRTLRPFDPPGDEPPGGWVILYEPELHLGPGPDKLVPDLAGWRRERMPELPDVAAITLPPDWVCEVLSPGTQAIDRGKKMRIYRREGVEYLWFVDPAAQLVEVFRLVHGRSSHLDTYEGDNRARLEPFEAIEIDIGALWAR
ncbi:Uma2 family endonuclease [Polyangium sp. 6x1]|uniref:Uma2 family endonuclease n=1 Tax=Polyangium sp. 6x1 TaxID=3042689 RepID=UPI002482F5CB|nr:Uma2 family endonuclease [Polyangium sp. 6x1]MDI1444928.1 Uma2 family endonuclease [Polyangium sp. 6x1]